MDGAGLEDEEEEDGMGACLVGLRSNKPSSWEEEGGWDAGLGSVEGSWVMRGVMEASGPSCEESIKCCKKASI